MGEKKNKYDWRTRQSPFWSHWRQTCFMSGAFYCEATWPEARRLSTHFPALTKHVALETLFRLASLWSLFCARVRTSCTPNPRALFYSILRGGFLPPDHLTSRHVDGVAWTAAMRRVEPSRASQSRLAARRGTAAPRPTAKCKVSSVWFARFGPAWLGYVCPSPPPSSQLTADRAKRCRLWRQTADGAPAHADT